MSLALVLDVPGPAATQPLTLTDRPHSEPGPGQLVVAVRACGVCRTDLQLVEGDLDRHRHPVVPGHQVVGEVVAVGGDTHHHIGQRVGVTWLAGVCGHCRFCTSGRENLCEQATFHGWDHDGGFADEMTVDDGFAFAITSDRADPEIAPLLCAGVIGHRALRVSGVRAGQHLGLYGFGSSAALVLQLAVAQGVIVHVATRNPSEQSRAASMGATSVGEYHERPPTPLHAAITFAPVGSVVVDALGALERGGTVVVNAIHLDEIPAFDYDLLWHERVVRSVANVTRTDIRELLALDATLGLRVDHRTYPLDEANQALRDLADGTVGGSGVLVP